MQPAAQFAQYLAQRPLPGPVSAALPALREGLETEQYCASGTSVQKKDVSNFRLPAFGFTLLLLLQCPPQFMGHLPGTKTLSFTWTVVRGRPGGGGVNQGIKGDFCNTFNTKNK